MASKDDYELSGPLTVFCRTRAHVSLGGALFETEEHPLVTVGSDNGNMVVLDHPGAPKSFRLAAWKAEKHRWAICFMALTDIVLVNGAEALGKADLLAGTRVESEGDGLYSVCLEPGETGVLVLAPDIMVEFHAMHLKRTKWF